MLRYLLPILLLVSGVLNAQEEVPQKETKNNVFSNASDATKLSLGKQKLYAGDYTSAMASFKEIEKNNPNNSGIKYYIAYCQVELNQKDLAKKNLETAIELNSDLKAETHLLMAQLLQEEENFSKALAHLDRFDTLSKLLKPDPETILEAKLHRSQCSIGKTLIESPRLVNINNLGPEINSKYDDKNPCISADGTKLVFTTRRPETTNSNRDIEGDGGFFEERGRH